MTSQVKKTIVVGHIKRRVSRGVTPGNIFENVSVLVIFSKYFSMKLSTGHRFPLKTFLEINKTFFHQSKNLEKGFINLKKPRFHVVKNIKAKKPSGRVKKAKILGKSQVLVTLSA